jgi:hypothetical protein
VFPPAPAEHRSGHGGHRRDNGKPCDRQRHAASRNNAGFDGLALGLLDDLRTRLAHGSHHDRNSAAFQWVLDRHRRDFWSHFDEMVDEVRHVGHAEACYGIPIWRR